MSNARLGPAIRKRLWVGVLLVMAVVLFLSAMRYLRPAPETDLPQLGLMTTLPLQWSEGGIEAAIASSAAQHPAYARLKNSYDVTAIDDLADLGRAPFSTLMLAQNRALSPDEFMKLDSWVRSGGRLLVLADPALQWGSLYPIGDKRRPLFTSLMSPLFSHWGIELVLPVTQQVPLVEIDIDDKKIRTQTPGAWQATDSRADARCIIDEGYVVADCSVGKGRALLVADADFLDAAYWQGQGLRSVVGGDSFDNMDWTLTLLSRLRTDEKNLRDFVGK